MAPEKRRRRTPTSITRLGVSKTTRSTQARSSQGTRLPGGNAEDDNGENWTLLDNAADPSQVRVGAVMVAGTPRFWSVVRITGVDSDGQVHFVQLDENDPAARTALTTVA